MRASLQRPEGNVRSNILAMRAFCVNVAIYCIPSNGKYRLTKSERMNETKRKGMEKGLKWKRTNFFYNVQMTKPTKDHMQFCAM